MNIRRASVAFIYQNKDISEDIAEDILSASYQEGFGQADTVSVTLQDRDDKWLLDWHPRTGDKLKLKILVTDWEDDGDNHQLSCGTFLVDELEYSSPPKTICIKGNSLPSDSNFIGTAHSRTWKSVTLKALFQSLLPKSISLSWQASTSLMLAYAEQDEVPDLEYISTLAAKYGLRLKLLNNKLVVWDAWELDAQPPAKKYSRDDLAGYAFRHSATRTQYDACRIKYQSASEGKEISFTYPAGVSSGKILEISESVFSLAEAEKVARGALWSANAITDAAELTLIMGTPSLYAGKNIELVDIGEFDGVYGLDNTYHEVSGSGYITTLSIHKVLKDPTPISSAPAASIDIGDVVNFVGGSHYVSSDAAVPTGKPRTAGTAKVTNTKVGLPHPYHLIGISSNVYGWVDATTVSKEE